MALIKCSECDGQVSDKAAACPVCGAPPSESAEPTEVEQAAGMAHRIMRMGLWVVVIYFGYRAVVAGVQIIAALLP
jgi:hypothetical protein